MAGNGQNIGFNFSTSPAPVLEKSCFTHLNFIKFSYVWTIDHFGYSTERMGRSFKSSPYFSGTDDKLKWYLELYPNGSSKESQDCLSLFLKIVERPEYQVQANFKMSILNAEKEEKLTKRVKENQAPECVKENENDNVGWGFHKFVSRDFLMDEANGLLPDDKLTIFCEGYVVGDRVNYSNQPIYTAVKVPDFKLSDDMSNMFDTASFNDVTLCAQGREFQVHKAVLAARSSVFRAMFEHPLQESTSNRVDIPDIDHEVLNEMLQFVYTGKAPNVDAMSADLLAAAHKYQLERLKVMCEESMCTNLAVNNACEVLVLADLHRASQLKQHAIDFINGHVSDVMDTQGWKTMVTNQPHLISDVISALAKQHCPILEPPRKRIKLDI